MFRLGNLGKVELRNNHVIAMKRLLIASLVIGPTAAMAQDLSQKVSFSAPAARAEVLLKELSAKTGVTFETGAQTKDAVLLIQVDGVELKELMDRIADAAYCEWRKETNSYRLTRPVDKIRLATKVEIAARAEKIAAAIAKAKGEVDKLPAFTDAEAKRLAQKRNEAMRPFEMPSQGVMRVNGNLANLSSESPGGRAVIGLLAGVPAAELAALADTERIVYAIHPTRMQRPLTGNSQNIVRSLIQQQQMFANATKRSSTANEGQMIVIPSLGNADMGPGDPSLGVGQAAVVVQRTGENFQATLTDADTQGKTIVTASHMLQVAVPARPAAGAGPKIELSPLAAEVAKVCSTGGGLAGAVGGQVRVMSFAIGGSGATPAVFTSGNEVPNVPISPELRERLTNPERSEAFALAPGEALATLASQKKSNLVAFLPDTALVPLSGRLSSSPTFEGFVAMLPANGITLKEEASWLTATPAEPATAWDRKVDRAALGTLVRRMQGQGLLRLDDQAAYALSMAKARSLSTNEIDGRTLNLLNAGAAQSAQANFVQPHILRFYGSLAQGQRATLSNGGSIPYRSLTQNQQAYLSEDVFQSIPGPNIDKPDTGGGATSITTTIMARGGMVIGGAGDLLTERTQVLAGGIPSDSQLSLRISRTPAVYGTETQSGASGIADSMRLAGSMISGGDGPLGMLSSGPKFDRFQPAEQLSLQFLLTMTSNASLSRGLSDVTVNFNAPKVTFDQLPSDFRENTLKLAESLRNGLSNVRVGAPGRNIPPAP